MYDDNDNLEYIFDADGNKTEYVYDSRDRLKAVIYPGAAGSIQYTYNKNDQVATSTDLNGTTVTNTYDPDGRLTMRTAIQQPGWSAQQVPSMNHLFMTDWEEFWKQ